MVEQEPEQPARAGTSFVLSEGTRLALAQMASQAAAQVAASQQMAAIAAKAIEQMQPALDKLAADVSTQVTPLLEALAGLTVQASAGLSGRSEGRATVLVREPVDQVGVTDHVTVSLTTHSTLSAVGELSVATEDDGELGEDMYRLLGAVLMRLDDVADGQQELSPAEFYSLLTTALGVLVALLAWLKPLTPG
jgi:hypothetical protein